MQGTTPSPALPFALVAGIGCLNMRSRDHAHPTVVALTCAAARSVVWLRRGPMKRHLIALSIAIGACAIADAQATSAQEQEVALVAGVDLKTGITFDQANAIAEFYFQHHISGCGSADAALDRGSRWEVTPRIGYAGSPGKDPIIIDKHTGRVSWKGGPAFDTVWELLFALT